CFAPALGSAAGTASGAAWEPAATPTAAPRPALDNEAVAGPLAEQPARSAQTPSAAPAARRPEAGRGPGAEEGGGGGRGADMPMGRARADARFPPADHGLASPGGPVSGGTSRRMQTRSEPPSRPAPGAAQSAIRPGVSSAGASSRKPSRS